MAEHGQSVLEYALVLALVSILIVVSLGTVASETMSTLAARIGAAIP